MSITVKIQVEKDKMLMVVHCLKILYKASTVKHDTNEPDFNINKGQLRSQTQFLKGIKTNHHSKVSWAYFKSFAVGSKRC